MKKKDYVFLYVIGLMAIILIFCLLMLESAYKGIEAKKERADVVNNVNVVASVKTETTADKLEDIKVYASEVAIAHIYNDKLANGKLFMCGDFSKELVKILSENNYNASCVIGMYEGYSHEWVKVGFDNQTFHIEATNGEVYREADLPQEYSFNPYQSGRCV